MIFLPPVTFNISLVPGTSHQEDIHLQVPDVIQNSQELFLLSINNNKECTISNSELILLNNKACQLSYAVDVSRPSELIAKFNTCDHSVNAAINLRYINETISLSAENQNNIEWKTEVNQTFSPKKIRYPLWALCLYFWIAFSFLVLYNLGNFSLYEKLFNIIQNQNLAANIFITLFFIFVAFLYTANRLALNPFHFVNLYSDAANIASFAAAYAQPQNFAGDPFLSNPANYQGYFVFHVPLIRGLGNIFGNYATAFTILLFPTILLQLFGYFLLGKNLFRNRFLGLLLSIITIFSVSVPYFSNEFFGLYGDVIPRFLFQAMLPYALILLSYIVTRPNRWWLGSIAFILLFYIHPVSGPNWLMALFFSFFIIMRLQYQRILWKPLIVSILISLLGLLPFIQAFFVPSNDETMDLPMIKEIYAYRLSSQTGSILHLFRYFIQTQIAPYTTEIFLWSTSLIFLVAVLLFIGKMIISKKVLHPQNQKHVIAILLTIWWIITLISTIGIPLLDELYTHTTGNLPVFREIRRNIRYLFPLTWITFFWITQQASEYGNNLKNNPSSNAFRANVFLFAIFITAGYFYQVQPFTDPVIQRSISCLQQGKLICSQTNAEQQKVEFYDHICSIVQSNEIIFPDPTSNNLGDSLIPRYYCQRSIAYTYKDGSGAGSSSMEFIKKWWNLAKQMETVLPTSESPLDLRVLQIAKKEGADYFIFINPDPENLTQIDPQYIVFQNDYGILYELP